MFGILSKLLTSVATFLFPVFASYKALKANDPAQLTPWLMYWVVIACVLVVESWIGFVLVWVPFYQEIKAGFMLWLVLPQFQGATRLYVEYVHPFLENNEKEIEDFISKSHDRAKAAGVDYLKKAIQYLEEAIFGIRRAPQAENVQPTNESYAASLLSRFRMSNPVAGGNGLPQDFFQFLSNAFPTAAASSSSAPAAPTNFNFPDSLFSSSGVPQEQQPTYLATQTERLRSLLAVLERQQQATPRSSTISTPQTPGTPDSSPLPKNMSCSTLEDFESVSRMDAPSPPPTNRSGSSGWLFGWRGQAPAQTGDASKGKEHAE